MHQMWLRVVIAIGLIVFDDLLSRADDWPQWMGPRRDNVWRETGLVATLSSPPDVVWRAEVAGGYSGPAVAGGKVYVTDYEKASGDDKPRGWNGSCVWMKRPADNSGSRNIRKSMGSRTHRGLAARPWFMRIRCIHWEPKDNLRASTQHQVTSSGERI